MWRRFTRHNSSPDPLTPNGKNNKSPNVRKKQSVDITQTEEQTEAPPKSMDDEEGVDEKHKAASRKLQLEAAQLIKKSWYHGLMPRDEIEDMLTKDGDFLVRKTEVSKHVRYVTTVMWQGKIKHILLNFRHEMWSLKDLKKPTISELIDEHVNEKIQIMPDGTLLVKGVSRPSFYILHEHIELKNRLGGGAFGDVFSAIMKNKDDTVTEVAVKRLKGMMMKKQRAEFVKEAKLMQRFNHPNIVKVYGVAPQEEPLLIVLELAHNGSLRSVLKEHPETGKDTLLRYATDACRGMCYLASRKVIHRDIAARNCLIGKNDEVKISDFGLSVADRELVKLDKGKPMPVKWLSPEVLRKGEFTTKSDVWAYAVLIWEIFVHCKTEPFPGETNAQAKVKILSGQQPMAAPEGSPEVIHNVMNICFTQDLNQRPDFEHVFKLLAPKEVPPTAN